MAETLDRHDVAKIATSITADADRAGESVGQQIALLTRAVLLLTQVVIELPGWLAESR